MDKTNKGAAQDGLENLPEKDKQETQKILDEIKAEEGDGQKPPAEDDAKAKADAEAKAKTDAEAKAKADADAAAAAAQKPRKKAKLVPEYTLRVAEAQAQKREEKLKLEIEELKKGQAPTAEKKSDEKPLESEDVDSELKTISEESGVPEASLKKLLGVMQKAAGKTVQSDLTKLREELAAKSENLDALTTAKELEQEERGFNEDFEKNVLPLIKKEYGDDISPDDLSDIKESLKEKAYDPNLVTVPIVNLYTGWNEFRGLVTPKKKSGEEERGGSERIPASGSIDFDNITEEQLAGLSSADAEKYFKYMESKEK